MSLLRLLLGRPLANRERETRAIGAFEGVPAMGLDALASSSYGPEAALTILMVLGAAASMQLRAIMLAILALLVILYVSYRQTIRAYPSHGGGYTVARENLGVNVSLLAAAALMIDYVLNVAVAISAGVGALISAVPELHRYILELCLGALALLTVINLRGTLDAGRIFAVPTYLFVGSFLSLLALGTWRTLVSGGHPQPIVPPPPPSHIIEAASLWLLLRAFASGCTAMTGVEAVSNGVSAFREPRVKNGHRTLTAIVVILGLLLGGIGYLVGVYNITAMDQTAEGYQSILSQLAGAVVGRGVFYYVAIGSLLCVLCLSANTSFTAFPRLCQQLAKDGFLPRPFAMVGRRLVYSVGILYLMATAGLLLIAFGGITDRLIPLFAIGAFLTFTLSQAGMVAHWHRERRRRAGRRIGVHLAVNAVGAVTTGVGLLIMIAAKFIEGAWITILVIPLVILLLKSIKRYYDEVSAVVREDGPLRLSGTGPPLVIIAAENWNRLTDSALSFALRISPEVMAVHLCRLRGDGDESDAAEERSLRERWYRDVERPVAEAGLKPPRLLLLQSPYRQVHTPLLRLIAELRSQSPGRQIAVLIPEIVKRHWWEHLLYMRRGERLRTALLRYGGPSLVVINVPWYLHQPRLEDALEDEEASRAARRESPGKLVPGAPKRVGAERVVAERAGPEPGAPEPVRAERVGPSPRKARAVPEGS